MTDSVIKRVHDIARRQDAPTGMTFGDYKNNVTILDIETGSIDSENDDDDASDASFMPDDGTVETVLTGVVSEQESDDNSLRSGNGYGADEDDNGSTTESVGNDIAATLRDYNNDVVIPGDHDNNNNDENAADADVTNEEGNITDATEAVEENDNLVTEEHVNAEDTDRNVRTGLRESVTRSHLKYGAA